MPSLASINSNLLLSFKLVGRVTPRFPVLRIFYGSNPWTVPTDVDKIDYLVLAGGGSGAAGESGGGAGGFLTGTDFPVVAGANYIVTVGAGGASITGLG